MDSDKDKNISNSEDSENTESLETQGIQENLQNSFQEMQALEQSLQNTLSQKQSFQLELSETESALKEIETAGDEVYKVIGQMMIKSDKSQMKEELENKKKFLDLRVQNLEKQEASMMEKFESLRNQFTGQGQ